MPSALVLFENTRGGPTTFEDTETNAKITWQGKNSPMGGHVQPVPRAIVDGNPSFQRAVARGILVPVPGQDYAPPDYADALSGDAALAAAREAAEADAIAGKVDRSTAGANALVGTKCLGPGCEQIVTRRANDETAGPPLCDTHDALAVQFYPVYETNPRTPGVPHLVWHRRV